MQHRVRAYNIIWVGTQAGLFRRWLRMYFLEDKSTNIKPFQRETFVLLLTYQYVPHILIGTFERTKPYANTQRSMSSPIVTGSHVNFSNRLGFTAVNDQFYFLPDVITQRSFQNFIVLILRKYKWNTIAQGTGVIIDVIITNLVEPMATTKSKNASRPAASPGEFSCTYKCGINTNEWSRKSSIGLLGEHYSSLKKRAHIRVIECSNSKWTSYF